MLLKGIKSSCKLGVRGFRNAAWFSDKTYLHSKKDVMQDYYLRKPKDKKKILHPETKKFISQTTQPLPPLKYKLHELPEGFDFYDQLGLREDLPFRIERTQSGNLPVYRRYKQGGDVKRTEIRKISGDLDEFCVELKKVVSHADIYKKVGRVVVKGFHKESVDMWLYRLGF